MEQNLYIKLFIITSYSSFIFCLRIKGVDIGVDKCHLQYDRYGESCLKDGSGYAKWSCFDNKSSKRYGTYVKDYEISCEQGHRCRCLDKWGLQKCDCISTRNFPSFPLTGAIRWNGTIYLDDDWWVNYHNIRIVSIPGEIIKDNLGRFLHKWTHVEEWEYMSKKLPKTTVKFEIIIPNGDGTSLKYTGDDSSKACKTSIITYEPSLSAFYKENNINGNTLALHELESSSESDDTSRRETWELVDYVEDGKDNWKWEIDYDTKTQLAYPLRYLHRHEDGSGGTLKIVTLDYNYQPIDEEEDITIRLKDFCDRI